MGGRGVREMGSSRGFLRLENIERNDYRMERRCGAAKGHPTINHEGLNDTIMTKNSGGVEEE